jgi:RNA polymerase sigma factor (TIGR02999 family)
MSDVTRILSTIEQGDPHAAEQLLPQVYDELRRLAAQKMAQEAARQTLQATALVHEVYVRLVDREKAQHWNSRGHFFAAAAEAMRRILVENARRKRRVKHGGGRQRIELEEASPVVEPPSDDLLALDEALTRLAERDPVRAELVKLRFFAGLTMPEAAQALGLSLATAERYWTFVRVWLYAELTAGRRSPPSEFSSAIEGSGPNLSHCVSEPSSEEPGHEQPDGRRVDLLRRPGHGLAPGARRLPGPGVRPRPRPARLRGANAEGSAEGR